MTALSLDERIRVEQQLLKRATPAGERLARADAQQSGPCALSFAQQRLWFLNQLEPNQPYNIPWSVRLTGPLDVDALRRALETIVLRHAILRTRYTLQDGNPLQVVDDDPIFELGIVDLRSEQSERRDAELHIRLRAEAARPFDLARDLMLRATVYCLGGHEHALMLVLHHIAADGWSMGVFLRELSAHYEAFIAGRQSPLPDLALQFADFAVWQRNWLSGEILHRQLTYWRKRLQDVAPLELPISRPRPPLQTFSGAAWQLEYPRSLLKDLRGLGRLEGTTVYMTLLAAFQTLLHKYAGQNDIVVGSPIAGRTRVETEPLIGFFVNTLVLRTDCGGNPSFRDVLARVRETTLDAYAHQDVPFEKLVEELGPERHANRTPFFDVMFMLQNAQRENLRIPGLTAERIRHGYVPAKFDLTLSLSEGDDGLSGAFIYNTDLFDEATIARMAGHFGALLEAVVADPDRRMGDLPLLTEAERSQLRRWNETETANAECSTVHALVAAQVERTPNVAAVTYGSKRLSYVELNRRANALAHHLQALGVRPESLVGLCVERSLEMAIGMLGVLKADAAYVPLDPEYPKDRLAVILEESAPRVILTQRNLRDRLPAGIARVVYLDPDESFWHANHDDPPIAATPDHLAYVLYTSGSTGRPKGVAMRHGALVNLLRWQQGNGKCPGAVSTLQFASMNFDVSFQEIFSTWASGGSLFIASEEDRHDPSRLASLLADKRIERAFLPPVVLQHLAEAQAEPGRRPLDLREIITAGEQLQITPQILKFLGALDDCCLHNHYGPTEAHVVTAYALTGAPAEWPVLPPIGTPIANARIHLLDRYGQPVPVGIPGELCIGGACLARGYLNDPALTAARFVPDPFTRAPGARLYRTGDLARYRPDGAVEYLGRIDDQVKVRGFRIELGEIEEALRQHPNIREAVAMARKDAAADTRLVAYFVPRNGVIPGPSDVRDLLKKKLPSYMIPSAFVPLTALPLTPTGKVDRRALPAPEHASCVPADADTDYRNTWEAQLALVWEELLGVSPVGRTEDFFEIGGHSMLAVRLMARIKAVFGKEIPLVALFQAPTVEQLARVLREHKGDRTWPTLVPVQRGGTRPPLFCIARPNVNALGYAFLARHLGPDQPLYVLQCQYREENIVPYSQAEYADRADLYIEAMRAVQPEGPYYFTGLCDGSHIAFEMARKLETQGKRIALLAVLDTWCVENTRSFLFHIYAYERRLRRFWRMNLRGKAALALRTMRAGVRCLSRILPAPFHRAEPPAENPWHRRYFPGSELALPPIAGRIVVFRVRKQPYWRTVDPTLGWANRSETPVDVHVIPGEHGTLLRPPHVRELADGLSQLIPDR